MIHVLTVHWQDDRWVDVQMKYLNRHVAAPFKTYAFLNHLPRDHSAKFFYTSTEPIESHAIKLNLLADMAVLHAQDPSDWLLFLDGDAFPIADVVAFGGEKLRQHPLVAVQRGENYGDTHPHPSFCLTTAGFWREVGGDWKAGHTWTNSQGRRVTDTGGNLLAMLEARGVHWHPMVRTNTRDLHPLFFGIYDHVVYHHGAAFRRPLARVDHGAIVQGAGRLTPLYRAHMWLPGTLPRRLRKLVKPLRRIRRRVLHRNQKLSEQVYRAIVDNDSFYRYFQDPGFELSL
jgi:hypothetical protein